MSVLPGDVLNEIIQRLLYAGPKYTYILCVSREWYQIVSRLIPCIFQPIMENYDSILMHFIRLTSLNLDCNDMITDAGIQHLTRLGTLNLRCNKRITNAGIQHLSGLTSLNLRWNDVITDTGIQHLTNLTNISRG